MSAIHRLSLQEPLEKTKEKKKPASKGGLGFVILPTS